MSTRANTLLVAAVSVCSFAFAQPSSAPTDPQSQLVEQIDKLRSESGATTPELIAPLHVLGLLYQETDEHALAIAALEKARYVTRVHSGLSSVDEALLLRQQIRSEDAIRDYERAWQLEHDMFGVESRCANGTLDEILALPLLDSCLEAVIQKQGHVLANVGSRVSLVRLIAYEIRSAGSAADRATAFVELADWHLLATPIDRRRLEASTGTALEIYERGYHELARAEQRDLVHLIESTSFRPRFVDGQLADSAPVVLRYGLDR